MDDTQTLRNIYEELVATSLDDGLKGIDICKCEQCKKDIMAFALNRLPPHYVVTEKGGLFEKVNAMSLQARTDILTAIVQGAARVGSNPRHKKGGEE